MAWSSGVVLCAGLVVAAVVLVQDRVGAARTETRVAVVEPEDVGRIQPPRSVETNDAEAALPRSDGGGVTLREAMAAAVANVDGGNGTYRTLLAGGEAIVSGHAEFGTFTKAFARELSEVHRRAWLRGCMDLVADRGGQRRIVEEIAGRYGYTFMKVRVDVVGPWPERVYIAVFNVAGDGELKTEALARWNEIAARQYNDELSRRAPYAKLRTIPIWD